MKERIANFIKEYAKANPHIRQTPHVKMWLEIISYFNLRVDDLCEPVLDSNLNLASGKIFDKLKSTIYYPVHATPGLTVSASIAFHNDQFLWLDDQSNNEDFEYFLQIEDRPFVESRDLVEFILGTKFYFLVCNSRWKIIEQRDDIPDYNDERLRRMKTEQLSSWKNHIQRLDDIEQKIHPIKTEIKDDDFQISFCFWTQTLGEVFSIDCNFQNQRFDWKGKRIGFGIGDYFVPR